MTTHWDLRYVGDVSVSMRRTFRDLAVAARIPPQRRVRVVVLPRLTKPGLGAAACALTGLDAIDGLTDAGVIDDERGLGSVTFLSPLIDDVDGLELRVIKDLPADLDLPELKPEAT